jgi:hypothetical protein
LVSHQLVVQLTQPVLPRRVSLKGLACEVVVIDYENVCVSMAADGVRMHDHHVVRAVHPLGHLAGNIGNALHVTRRAHIELVRMEREHIAVEHVFSPVSFSESLCPSDECGGRRILRNDRESYCRRPRRSIGNEPNP